MVEIRDRKARNILPWTHEQAADEYARMLDADRMTARRIHEETASPQPVKRKKVCPEKKAKPEAVSLHNLFCAFPACKRKQHNGNLHRSTLEV